MVQVAVFLLGGLTALLVCLFIGRPVVRRLERMLRELGDTSEEAGFDRKDDDRPSGS